ncbi:hypothetical protein JCM21900_002051 [Sporobolomyces salmonicolor]
MARFALLAALVAATLSLSSALTIPTSTSPAEVDRRDLLGLSILSGHGALIDLDILANVLGPEQCSANAVVGITAEINIGSLLHICACIEILNVGDNDKQACPSCPANASPICGSGQCGCQCSSGHYASHDGQGCLPNNGCTSTGGKVVSLGDGTSECQCASPYVSNGSGGCALPASARSRNRNRTARSQLTLDSRGAQVIGDDELKCPDGERACPIGSDGGWECLDVTTSLDSCGGCPGERSSVNCLTIPGAAGVSCVESVCEISSCFPGYRYLNGRCLRVHA